MNYFLRFLQLSIVLLITGYQKTLSPDHGWLKTRYPYGYCRHYPSCSQYTKEAVIKFGAAKGVWLGFWRVLRCNPWSKPSVDVIPNS